MKDEYDSSAAKRGPVIAPQGKTRITIWIDDEVLARFRERANKEGRGYQTLMNETLRGMVSDTSAPVTLAELRKVLREELRETAA